MGHATSQGLTQEEGALIPLAQLHLPDLEPRRVDQAKLDNYAELTRDMESTVAASGGKTSDKEQLTYSEAAARDELLADVRRIQHGAKRTFKAGSPQLKEFFVGEHFNHSTALLLKWATGIAAAWTKYEATLIEKGNLVKQDIDTLKANAAVLGSVDSSQERAKHIDAPEATAAAQKAMADVIAAADFIYGAAEAAYAKRPEILGEFEKIKPLRFAVNRPPKTPPPPEPPKS